MVHNLLFLQTLSIVYDAKRHTPFSPLGGAVIVVPILGALGVIFLTQKFAPEARGPGVPEVMDAIYNGGGQIRPRVALIKSLASALSIGSGGSLGREGPIVQIGATFGSMVGQLLRLTVAQRSTLIAAGAGAGIAATFNTPIGGVLFAAELLLREVSVWSLVPVIIATVVASYVGWMSFGTAPSFTIPKLQTIFFPATDPIVLVCYLFLGLLAGLVSAGFIRAVYAFEDCFEAIFRHNSYIRHAVGMLLVGMVMYVLMRCTGHYYVQGLGYATIQDILLGALNSPAFLLLLFVLKLAVTSTTLGSGGSGGIFSPVLFLGAAAGSLYGHILMSLFPQLNLYPAAFAIVGMAGVVAGTTGAALTAIVMLLEMTRTYSLVVPMILAVATSYGLRKLMSNESIYTMKLVRHGRHIPEARL